MALTLFAVNNGYFDDVDVKKALAAERSMRDYLKGKYADLVDRMETSQGPVEGRRSDAARSDQGLEEERDLLIGSARPSRRHAAKRLKAIMPGTKEIRVKIRSVQNTRKITKAMEMVAASKMRKAQERMRTARPYGEKIRNVAAHISHCQSGVPPSVPGRARHRQARRHHRDHHRQGAVRRAQYQRAAPGAEPLQAMASRRARRSMSAASAARVLGFMQRLGANIASQVTGLGDRPHIEKLIGAVKVMLDGYISGPLRSPDAVLYPLHQHDEAGAGDGAAAAADRASGWVRPRAPGTTSTSRKPRRCSTRC